MLFCKAHPIDKTNHMSRKLFLRTIRMKNTIYIVDKNTIFY